MGTLLLCLNVMCTMTIYRRSKNWECCCCNSWSCCWEYSGCVTHHPGDSSVGSFQKKEKRLVDILCDKLILLLLFSESVRLKSNDSSIEMDNKFDVSVTCVVSVYCYNPHLL